MTKVLIVEDEISFSDALAYLLKKESYEVEVAVNGAEAIERFQTFNPDLILLDLMIPEVSGTEVCRVIRSTSQVPIIMLTAKDSEIDKVVGLELGADDYVTKPYSSRELLARMKAVMRRNSGESAGIEEGALLTAGSVRMDLDKHQVTVNSVAVTFPLKEFELLEFLMRNSGRVLTRSQLIDRVWGNDYFGDTKTLDVHIKRLRAKIEEDPANPKIIHTIRGLGYKLEI
ncbi:OmpR Response regulators consisting of a CheY-like receiver domain and a winged-helix DNA-binding domain [Candidatus Nanopelagicaceae bacterium]|jgi:two-component system response regulator RegX3|uniref:Sensory transduction protein RegX3 n=1 Tax=Candidatus Planktophila lacus TaxID=1884913 RepID=A0AAD0E2Z1_9ACTN|nr:response regulator transcription factor [Candidatus Planktophila lacus]ASY10279.1 two-component system, OmpR family, response regulator RegX3 [Candidatus Planktophila lacus]ASY24746.1 two-component system, OmpR family, response regulator RegX3 [Candidatus Planktophila lacus]